MNMRSSTTPSRRPSLEQAVRQACERHPVNIARAWGQVLIRADEDTLTITQAASRHERYGIDHTTK